MLKSFFFPHQNIFFIVILVQHLSIDFKFKILDKQAISKIAPLIQEFTDNKFPSELLVSRFEAMFSQNYECLGVFKDEELIGVCGLWFQTRHYSGKSCESIMFLFKQSIMV